MLQLKRMETERQKMENLLIPVLEDRDLFEDPKMASLVKEARRMREFKGEAGDELILHHPETVDADRAIFLGCGKYEKLDRETLRAFAGKGVKKCIRLGLDSASIAVPSPNLLNREAVEILEPLMEGAALGNHLFDRYKQKKKHRLLKNVELITFEKEMRPYRRLNEKTETICQGTIMAREWINMPSNDKRPEVFAKIIIGAGRKYKLKTHLLNEPELRRKGFGAMLAVSAGSQSKAQLVILEHDPGTKKKPIVLVGKGVTFDSGGISLKPSAGMEDMKTDMSGAAAVAATLITAARLNFDKRIIGVIPIVENMPSGSATRPGDIVKSYTGKTVEIVNTDAEGRLILIDAMAYAQRTFQPEVMIDMATLTGACVVALGEKIAGLFTTDEDLAAAVLASGEKTFERCWRLPMPEDYRELLKSDFADIRNVAETRWGGAIQGALFLTEFIKDLRWAHIDIAGPSSGKKEGAYCNAGGTGFGVRLLLDVLEKL
ncbi:MAG: leucyl aminopeptidase [Thermodesulfobacteriota bacterium]